MVTTSYPKTVEDTTAPFIAAMAEGVAARGRPVDVVLPAHPQLVGGPRRGVRLHPYRYAPLPGLGRWGYAESMAGDVQLRGVAYAVAPLALAATLVTTGLVARRARSRLIHAHWVIPNGPPAALVAAAARRPLVISLHGSDVTVAERPGLPRRLAGWVFRRAAAITACSPDLAERAIALGASPTRTQVVPYGVDSTQFRPDPALRAAMRRELGLTPETIVLLTLGRQVYKKGFEHAITALAQLGDRPVVLVMAGDGDLRPALESQARAAGLGERVRFVGSQPRQRVPAWYAATDIFLLPSIHDQSGNVDGLPNVLLEALASGCAVVASDLAGTRLVIDDGVQGLIVPERQPAAIAMAVARLLDEPALRQRLAEGARRRAVQELTWTRCIDQLEAIYRHAIAASDDGCQGSPP